jgi:hypothetical protein
MSPVSPQTSSELEHIREPSLLFFVHILPTSVVFMGMTTSFAVFYRNVGLILSVGGSFCGFVLFVLFVLIVFYFFFISV